MMYKNFLRTVKNKKNFLISTHVNPDPDALASELVLASYLRKLGKKVCIVNAGVIPSMFSFMKGTNTIKGKLRKNVIYDAVIIVDCGNLYRIGSIKEFLNTDMTVMNIDHHVTNDFFGNVNVVDSKASSTSEIIYRILKAAKFKLTKTMAELLYVGIMTDTGSFRYENTSSYTHIIASELMKHKLSVNAIYKNLYEKISMRDIKNFLKLIRKFKVTSDGSIAYIELTTKRLKIFSDTFDIKDKIFTFLRSMIGIEVIAIFAEKTKKITRVNFRSQGKTDVAKISGYFNGGGHKKASGCVVDSSMTIAKKRVLAKVKEAIRC